jgi:hypothetical protein
MLKHMQHYHFQIFNYYVVIEFNEIYIENMHELFSKK